MFELKSLSTEGLAAALEKALRYRLLNEPREAESICRDIIDVDPKNHEALTTLILALTDQLTTKGTQCGDEARSLLPRLESDYEEAYYAGIICERRANAQLSLQNPGSGFAAHDLLHDAMEWYEKAEKIRPAGNDDAILRWNACARHIMESGHIRPHPGDDSQPMLE
jgi:tetratricopeptide (TPR) repeat protein